MASLGLRNSSARLLLACILSLTLACANAAEPLVARVLSFEEGRVTLALGNRQEADGPRLVVEVDEDGLPSDVRPGVLVKVWVEADAESGARVVKARLTLLQAELSGQDRTGVRSRLMYGASHGQGRGRGGR